MKVNRFNESVGFLDRRYKIDMMIVFKRYKRFKNSQHRLASISNMIDNGGGDVYLYSISEDLKDALIKSDKFGHTLQTVPIESLINFDLDEYIIFKKTDKYNL